MVVNETDLQSEMKQLEIGKEGDMSRIISFSCINQNNIPHVSVDHNIHNDKDFNMNKISPSKIFNSNKN